MAVELNNFTNTNVMDTNKRIGKMFTSSAGHLDKLITPINRNLAAVGAALVAVMALVIAVDVILRTLADHPLAWSIELEQFMSVLVVFFSIAYTLKKNGHVSVDIFSSKFSPKTDAVVNSIISVFGFYVFAILASENLGKMIDSYNYDEIAQVSHIPIWPFLLVIVAGSVLFCLVLLVNLFSYLGKILTSMDNPWLMILIILGVSAIVTPFPYYLETFSIEIGDFQAGLLGILILVALLFLGAPIAIAMAFIGINGNWYLSGVDTSLGIVRMMVYETVADYFFCVAPLFILMGFLCYAAGLSTKLYDAGYKWFGQFKGGISIATVFGCGGFSAICGDSLATAATMGSVALPEMKRFKYHDALATGCLAAGGTLGILIPPSMGFIVYGIITEQSVAALFMAGIIPGIILTLSFGAIIAIRCHLDPSLGPAGPKVSFREKIISLKGVLPVLGLFLLVIGGLYQGFFTPTEAGGVGATGALILALTSKELTRKNLKEAFLNTGQMTSMIFTILIAVNILGYFISLSDIPLELSAFIVSLDVSRYVILLLILLLYVVLGMIMNIIPMIMITIPIIYPTIEAMGFNPIWFGVIMVIIMEMGQITPPVGINVFVISGIAKDVPMITIFRGVIPFILVQILVLAVLIAFPNISLFIPNAMDTLATIPG